MNNKSKAAEDARTKLARQILPGMKGTIEIEGKKQNVRITKSGMIVGATRRNQNLRINPEDLRSSSGEPVPLPSFDPTPPDSGIDAMYGHGSRLAAE